MFSLAETARCWKNCFSLYLTLHMRTNETLVYPHVKIFFSFILHFEALGTYSWWPKKIWSQLATFWRYELFKFWAQKKGNFKQKIIGTIYFTLEKNYFNKSFVPSIRPFHATKRILKNFKTWKIYAKMENFLANFENS